MVYLSPKHGLNPSLAICFVCQQDKNEIVIPGKLRNDEQAPHKAVWDYEPCDKCKEHMEQGIIVISVDEKLSKNDMKNPYRTGGWCVVREDFIKRILSPGPLLKDILKRRMVFMPDDAWDKIGLPRS